MEHSYIDNDSVSISWFDEEKAVLIKAKKSYITEERFYAAFNEIAGLLATKDIKKMIFDKRTLKTFNEPSMIWYHVVWKESMRRKNGLVVHRKILPNDQQFRDSVKIGRQKIAKEHPEFNFNNYDIKYVETINEAIEK